MSMTDTERQGLIPGDEVAYLDDTGREWFATVKYAPWKLGHGEWVIGLDGIAGGYLLSRVMRKCKPISRECAEEVARLRSGLEIIAACRAVTGSAQGAFRSNLRIADAALAGADLRKVEVVEAVCSGTWKPA
jgi:hypothetical protein